MRYSITDELLHDLISYAATECPDVSFDFLDEHIYTRRLGEDEQNALARLIELARHRQADEPAYEPIFHQLLHLFVLNGSRLQILSRLDRRLRAPASYQNALVFISGNSGFGKTSLVMALRPRIRRLGSELLVARCEEHSDAPFSLWREVVYAIADLTDEPYQNLPAPIGYGTAAASIEHLTRTLTEWLIQRADQRQLVVLLDDLHWADRDSLVIFDRITSHERKPAILFICTYRDEERDLGYPLYEYLPMFHRNRELEDIVLASWTESDVERLTFSLLGRCSLQLIALLYSESAGHPFFTFKMLQSLIEQNTLRRSDDGLWLPPDTTIPIPGVLKQIISHRVQRLGRDAALLLRTASIVGEVWSLRIVEPLADLPEDRLIEALEAALRSDILAIENSEQESYRFTHGLIKQVLYDDQLARRRKQQHGRIANRIAAAQPDSFYAIAHHYLKAEHWEQAAEYCLAAGNLATRHFALFSARQWLEQALAAAEYAGCGLDEELLFSIYNQLGRSLRALQANDEAEDVYIRLREAARGANQPVVEGRALADLVRVRASLYQIETAKKTASEALRLGRRTADAGLLSQIYSSLAYLAAVSGELGQMSSHVDEALRYASTLDNWQTQSELHRDKAYSAIWAGGYEQGEKHARLSLEHALKTEDALAIAGGRQILSYAQIELGKYVEAHQHISHILDAVDSTDSDHHQLPRLLNQMGYLYLELGDAREALVWDKKALAKSDEYCSASRFEMRRYSLLNIATDCLNLGDPDAAQSTIRRFESITEASDFTRFRYFNRYQLLKSEAALSREDYSTAINLAREARGYARTKGMLKNVAKSRWFEGRALLCLHDYDRAVAQLEKAINTVDHIMHGSLRWKIRIDLALALKKAGRSPAVVLMEMREAIDKTEETLSSSPLLDVFLSSRWIARFKELEDMPTIEKQTYPSGLTPREVEVLRLAASGATNQQIADSLYISVRTVNTHMTNIFGKTGCANRTAATAFAVTHRLLST